MATLRDIAEETLRLAKERRADKMTAKDKRMTIETIPTDDERARSFFGPDGKVSRVVYACAYLEGRFPDCFFDAVVKLVPE